MITPTNIPKLACCNIIADPTALKDFAFEHGLAGIDWSFTPRNLPNNSADEDQLLKTLEKLRPLEVRYHCALPRIDPGNINEERAEEAMALLTYITHIVTRAQGSHLTIHVGLGRSSTLRLSWDQTLGRLAELVQLAANMGVRICLENLAWGWTSRPELFEKLIRKSGAWATIDIGHALASPSVKSQLFQIEDFIAPHPERCLNAHVYHIENQLGHIPPSRIQHLEARLELLMRLPHCNWWVLELHAEHQLLQTLKFVKQFLLRATGRLHNAGQTPFHSVSRRQASSL